MSTQTGQLLLAGTPGPLSVPRRRLTLSSQNFKDSTLAIHGGRSLDSHASSMIFPLYQTSMFVHQAVGLDTAISYSRVSNPTVDMLEKVIGELEGTPPAVCFRSGMAATTTLFLALLKAGDHVVLTEVIYGGTMRLFREVLDHFGVTSTFVDTCEAANVESAITAATRIVFIETPGNPTLKLTDIAAVARITKQHGVLLAVDNTFLTPILQKPLELGADISVLSTTKYIDGHNATVGGSIATRDEAMLERLRLIRKTLGTIQAPFEAWLTLQGVKTLPARALADRQQRAPGGMLAFELKAGLEPTIRMLNALKLCVRAESLGGLETLMTHPSTTTHADLDPELRRRLGIRDGLVRISVGLEAPEDILADLEQAFAAAGISAAQTTPKSNASSEVSREVR